MNKYATYSKLILVVVIPILAILSIIILIVNKGFYFSDFRSRVEVILSSENTDELNNAANRLNSNPNKALYNQEENLFYFQNISRSDVETLVSEVESETLNAEVKEVFVNNKYILQNYVWFVVFLNLVAAGTVFYVVLKEKGRISFKELFAFYLPYLITFGLSALIFGGLLSLVSRFAYITEFQFLPIFFINILLACVFFLSVYKLDTKEEFKFIDFSRRLFLTLKSHSLPFLIVMLVSMAAILVSFGLGVLSALASFIAALFVLYFTVMWLYIFLLAKFKVPKLPKKKKPSPKTEKPVEISTSKKKKKKSKKKKKK